MDVDVSPVPGQDSDKIASDGFNHHMFCIEHLVVTLFLMRLMDTPFHALEKLLVGVYFSLVCRLFVWVCVVVRLHRTAFYAITVEGCHMVEEGRAARFPSDADMCLPYSGGYAQLSPLAVHGLSCVGLYIVEQVGCA